jgi:formylglycine-generating enzyme required for sulfatase activity
MLADRIDRIFTELIDPDEDGRPKERVRWYRDLIMAAELGKERDWDLLRALINVDRLLRDLRHGLVAVLADIKQPLPSATRVCAGFFLGDLGDPRFPVTIEQWQREITRAHAGVTNGYFCPLPSRTGVPSLWIARYLVTNAQMQAWQRDTQQLPLPLAHDTNFNQPNQPVAGVNWFLAAEFCTWLEQQTGTHIRLPSESEWQIAAYGDDGRRYPWGNIRDTDRAAIKEDRDQRGWPYPVPVGCYPAGASAVGALDMAGNVWEWTADVWPSDAELTGSRSEFQPRVLRGGGYRSKKSQTSATGRIRQTPHIVLDYGFRVVLDLHDHVPVD